MYLGKFIFTILIVVLLSACSSSDDSRNSDESTDNVPTVNKEGDNEKKNSLKIEKDLNPEECLVTRIDAPFGLKWGMSKEEIRALGSKLEYNEEYDTYGLKNVPKKLNTGDAFIDDADYLVSIDKQYGLVYLHTATSVSREFISETYNLVDNLLTKKYGKAFNTYGNLRNEGWSEKVFVDKKYGVNIRLNLTILSYAIRLKIVYISPCNKYIDDSKKEEEEKKKEKDILDTL